MVLMPLAEDELQRRVCHLAAVGAVLTGTAKRPSSGMRPDSIDPTDLLAARFIEAGARLDYGAIQDLLATRPIEVLVDVLVELVIRFARREFLTRLSAEVTRRDLLARVVALAGETPDVTEEQLRARLVALHGALRRCVSCVAAGSPS